LFAQLTRIFYIAIIAGDGHSSMQPFIVSFVLILHVVIFIDFMTCAQVI
jgi:hypothetical protein